MSKKINNWIIALLGVSLAFSCVWGYGQFKDRKLFQALLENQNQSAFYTMVTSMDNLSLLTGKLMASASPYQNIALLQSIKEEANTAQVSLSSLPLKHTALTATEKYLNQIADYCSTVNKSLLLGKKMSEKDTANLKAFGTQLGAIDKNLNQLRQSVDGGLLTFAEMYQPKKVHQYTGDKTAAVTAAVAQERDSILGEVNDSLNQFRLEYDGKYSDHMAKLSAKGDLGEAISREQTAEIVKDLAQHLDHNWSKIEEIGRSTDQAGIQIVNYSLGNGEKSTPNVIISISSHGGKLISLVNNRVVQQAIVNGDVAQQQAEQFLKYLSYEQMTLLHQRTEDNIVTFTYSYQDKYKEQEIVCLNDEVKIKVALDNGEILGFYAGSYWKNHCTRAYKDPQVDLPTATAGLNQGLTVGEPLWAMGDNGYGGENMYYVFTGKMGDNSYDVYINAADGTEENILQRFSAEDGSSWLK